MEENKINHAIATMEHWIEYEKSNIDKINKAEELIEIQETILFAYKAAIKENRELKKEINNLKNIK